MGEERLLQALLQGEVEYGVEPNCCVGFAVIRVELATERFGGIEVKRYEELVIWEGTQEWELLHQLLRKKEGVS